MEFCFGRHVGTLITGKFKDFPYPGNFCEEIEDFPGGVETLSVS